MKLIIGLGNPGKKYHETRHNLGFMILDHLSDAWGFSFKKEARLKAEFAELKDTLHEKIFFLKPHTFMNLSGQSVWPLVVFFKLNPEDLMVIYDDIDLPLGKMRFVQKGQSGGHKGIASMIESLGTTGFHRLKVGIGRPEVTEKEISDHVLERFTADESAVINQTIATAKSALEVYLKDGIKSAMNQFNGLKEKKTSC
ncbi:MAG: aminoacyl-tRNA hydrolase [Deltaproteobacteria bacterium]|nr:aminoacyl-tRNA hydrolase [Deltaproteobacteria bacterium]